MQESEPTSLVTALFYGTLADALGLPADARRPADVIARVRQLVAFRAQVRVPVRDALRDYLLKASIAEDAVVLRRAHNGSAMTAGEMLDVLESASPVADDFLADVYGAAILAVATREAQRPEPGTYELKQVCRAPAIAVQHLFAPLCAKRDRYAHLTVLADHVVELRGRPSQHGREISPGEWAFKTTLGDAYLQLVPTRGLALISATEATFGAQFAADESSDVLLDETLARARACHEEARVPLDALCAMLMGAGLRRGQIQLLRWSSSGWDAYDSGMLAWYKRNLYV